MQENRLKHRLKQDVALNAEGLKVVQALMREKYISFTEALLFSEKVQDDYIYPVLAELSGIQFVRKEAVDLPENMRNILPEKTLRTHKIIPTKKLSEKVIEIVCTDPLDLYSHRKICDQEGVKFIAKYAERFRIESLHNITFGDSADLREVLDSFDEETIVEEQESKVDVMDAIAGAMSDEKDAPTVKYVQTLFKQAIRMKASDMHIEPRQKKFLIRFRIDGQLRDIPSPPKHLQDNIITIIKVMADLDISEKRAPQDGRIRLPFEGRDIDFRVNSLPAFMVKKS